MFPKNGGAPKPPCFKLVPLKHYKDVPILGELYKPWDSLHFKTHIQISPLQKRQKMGEKTRQPIYSSTPKRVFLFSLASSNESDREPPRQEQLAPLLEQHAAAEKGEDFAQAEATRLGSLRSRSRWINSEGKGRNGRGRNHVAQKQWGYGALVKKLMYLWWVTSSFPMYSMASQSQYPINPHGKPTPMAFPCTPWTIAFNGIGKEPFRVIGALLPI